MIGKHSAGVLLFRRAGELVEVLLVHPGGPFWRNRQQGAWQLPKGLIGPDEDPIQAARREAEEELGVRLQGNLLPLGSIRQKGGKIVDAFAIEQDFDPARLASNTFTMEWPPRTGRIEQFAEVDDARWFTLTEARTWILPSQAPLLDRLAGALPASS